MNRKIHLGEAFFRPMVHGEVALGGSWFEKSHPGEMYFDS